jgi:hypothetical protein
MATDMLIFFPSLFVFCLFVFIIFEEFIEIISATRVISWGLFFTVTAIGNSRKIRYHRAYQSCFKDIPELSRLYGKFSLVSISTLGVKKHISLTT